MAGHVGSDSSLTATIKLYHKHPAWKHFSAEVIALNKNRLVLRETIFYPEGGGQVCDRGTIDGIPVKNITKFGGRSVKISRNGLEPLWVSDGTIVVHELEAEHSFKVGQRVNLCIEAEHRTACSINHSAAHFLYAAIQDFLEAKYSQAIYTKGCHIGPQGFRFDLGNTITSEDLHEIYERMERFLRSRAAIIMDPVEGCDDVFLWKSTGITIPCGGTHVPDTGFLGPITLRRRSKGQTTTRIEGKVTGTL